ncbi:hypothetical protein SAMN04488540_101426 [Ferrimonas sediminum]|uniref:Uncharacterized protein n=1 Tax=Ferrimonas sediminum TaxID=718193 RepID=A0A1G8KMQ1_9GAMM|nr:hypothetical protein [Ferrimonas sediminum]SDI44672.1 hypothetical protein SAMN04488540_101426 [Ferrimonas sediminum]
MRSQSLITLIWLTPLLAALLLWKPESHPFMDALSAYGDTLIWPQSPLHASSDKLQFPVETVDRQSLLAEYQRMGPQFVWHDWVYQADDSQGSPHQFRRLHPAFPTDDDNPAHRLSWQRFYGAQEWGEWAQPWWLNQAIRPPMNQAFSHTPICREHRCLIELRLGGHRADTWFRELQQQLPVSITATMDAGNEHRLLTLSHH